MIGYHFGVDPRAEKGSAKQDQALMKAGLPLGQHYWQPLLMRGVDMGKRCPVEFMVSPSGRITA